ncbi:MAG: FtsB family cell division protein [Culicoidibacterales bacterium]
MSNKKLENKNEKQKKYSVHKGIRRRIILWLCLFGAIFSISIFYISQAIFTVVESKQTLQEKNIILEQQRQRQSVLESDLEKLDDPEFVKQYAREKFFYTSEDEILFKLPKEAERNETTTKNR